MSEETKNWTRWIVGGLGGGLGVLAVILANHLVAPQHAGVESLIKTQVDREISGHKTSEKELQQGLAAVNQQVAVLTERITTLQTQMGAMTATLEQMRLYLYRVRTPDSPAGPD